MLIYLPLNKTGLSNLSKYGGGRLPLVPTALFPIEKIGKNPGWRRDENSRMTNHLAQPSQKGNAVISRKKKDIDVRTREIKFMKPFSKSP